MSRRKWKHPWGVFPKGKMGVVIKKNPKLSSRVLFLNLDSATTYLPGRLPSEYCRREKSLRPCSGWERVVSFCLVTEKPLCFLLSKLISESIALRTGSCIMIIMITCLLSFRKSPRPISNARLRLLPNFHLHPINVVFCDGTY